jgi:hypothetical protein
MNLINNICIDCGSKFKLQYNKARCFECEMTVQKEKNKENYEKKLLKKEEDRKSLENQNKFNVKSNEIICIDCKKPFYSTNSARRRCGNPCKNRLDERKKMSESERWLSKKQHEKPSYVDSNMISRASLKEDNINKRFRACRG